MYVGMICLYVCLFVCVYVAVCVCMYTGMCVCLYVSLSCMYVCMYVSVCLLSATQGFSANNTQSLGLSLIYYVGTLSKAFTHNGSVISVIW